MSPPGDAGEAPAPVPTTAVPRRPRRRREGGGLGALSVRQPVLAIVMSVVVLIVGALAYLALPVAEYPDIVPPTVVVQTQYPGAAADTVAETVAAPIEQEINGVEGMVFLYSQATADGRLRLEVTFALGTDPDVAQVLVQNRVDAALPRLPEEVRRFGLTVRKDSPNLMMIVSLSSPDDTYDQLYISNYALRRVRDVLLRQRGVGSIEILGARDYSMRLWLDPDRMAEWSLSPGDLIAAVRSQNVQVAGGQLAEPPVTGQAFQPNLTFQGRLADPEAFGRIIVRGGADGRVLRLQDVARVELGAQSYATNSFLQRRPAVSLAINQRPGSNALGSAAGLRRVMEEIAAEFPPGLAYAIAYDPTRFIGQSVHELIVAIRDAVLLVALVIVVFLQRWRATLIPVLAIPVSLIGTFAAMAALGYSINNLTLFGLVLAVGIVVDDAIVVVENVDRHMDAGMGARDAALLTMREVGGALVSVALVLAAVFVPTAFLPGVSGQFFRQFAVTIAVATAISAFCSLTLSPALSSLILRAPHGGDGPAARRPGPLARMAAAGFGAFNRGFDALARGYARVTRVAVGAPVVMLAAYAALVGLAGWLLWAAPKGFIPTQDRGYAIVAVQLPGGASLARTTEVVRRVEEVLLATPGVVGGPAIAGFNGATLTFSPSAGALFPSFAPFAERQPRGLTAARIMADLRGRLGAIQEAEIVVIPPPPVPGIGNGGGFSMRLEDRGGRGLRALADAADALVEAANREPGLTAVFTPFGDASPQLYVDIDRTRAEMLGVPAAAVTEALETFFGSTYVNDFTTLGRPYRVVAQADLGYRRVAEDLARLRARGAGGQMVPIGTLIRLREVAGAERVPRYNLYPAAEVNGDIAPGTSAGAALAKMERLAREILPDGLDFEWTDLSWQQKQEGNAGLLVFPLCVVFVYLVLAAQYGSWSLPLAVILIVPMCLFAATAGVRIAGQDVNILTQIGFIVLVGLAAKNAILIVEFARHLEEEGGGRRTLVEAVVEACRLRLRPILMTSLAFILGVVPLVATHGAGAEMRQAVGVAVFAGMIGVTLFGLLFTPVFYVAVRRLAGRRRARRAASRAAAAAE